MASALLAAVLPERIEIFSQHQQGHRFGQRFFLEAKIFFEQLDLHLVLHGLVFDRSALSFTILETLAFPALHLLRIDTFLTAVLP